MDFTFDTQAWISQYNHLTQEQLRTNEGAATLQYSRIDLSSAGYTLAGKATVTVTIFDQRTLVENTIESLRSQSANIRAEATAKCTQIEGQIQQLLAIECSPAPAPVEEAAA